MPGLFPIGLSDRPTGRTLLTGISGVNRLDPDTKLFGLVGQQVSEAGKAPVGQLPIHVSTFASFYLAEVFENDNINVIALAQNRLDDASENIRPEAVLTSAEFPESLAGRRCAFGLKFSSSLSHLSGAEIQLSRRKEAVVGGYGYMSDALVNTQSPVARPLGRSLLRQGDIQEPALFAKDEPAAANLPGAVEELRLVG